MGKKPRTLDASDKDEKPQDAPAQSAGPENETETPSGEDSTQKASGSPSTQGAASDASPDDQSTQAEGAPDEATEQSTDSASTDDDAQDDSAPETQESDSDADSDGQDVQPQPQPSGRGPEVLMITQDRHRTPPLKSRPTLEFSHAMEPDGPDAVELIHHAIRLFSAWMKRSPGEPRPEVYSVRRILIDGRQFLRIRFNCPRVVAKKFVLQNKGEGFAELPPQRQYD